MVSLPQRITLITQQQKMRELEKNYKIELQKEILKTYIVLNTETYQVLKPIKY